MQRLFAYEELVDILLGVVDLAATSNNAVYSAAKFAELRGRLNEAVDVEEAVREGETELVLQPFARAIAAVDKVGAVVVGRRQRRSDERRRRSYEATAKRWRSGVDRQAEVGRREVLKRLYVGGEQPRSKVIVIDDDDDDDDDSEDPSGDDECDDDSLAEEGDDEMHGVDDDPDSQLNML
jgi:hypothetical protein